MMFAEMVRYTDDGMGLDEAIAAYLAACDVEGKSPRTVEAYAETLGMFHAICRQRGLPERVGEFRPAHVYAFLKVIADRGVSPRHAAPSLPGDARLLLLVYAHGWLRAKPLYRDPERQGGAEGDPATLGGGH